MLKILERMVRSSIQAIGLDLHRLSLSQNPFLQIRKGLEKFSVDLVFDIGANTGQFATELRAIGYKGRIVSFEPLSDAHKKLNREASRDAKWQVHPKIAIGDFDGEIDG